MTGLLQWLAVMFVVCAAATSVVLEGLVRCRTIDWNLAVDIRMRRAWWIAAAPWLVATAAVLVTAMPGLLEELGIIAGHCHLPGTHSSHHLCWHNPPPPSSSIVLNGIILAGALVPAWTLAREVVDLVRTDSLASQLMSLPHRTDDAPDGLVELETDRPLAVTVGLFSPITIVSTGLREAVSPKQWRAVLEHERAHARRRDSVWSLLFAVVSSPLLPAIRRGVRREYKLAVEQQCDRRAAQSVDKWSTADALVSVARATNRSRQTADASLGASTLSFDEADIARRVEALTRDGTGETGSVSVGSFLGTCVLGSLLVTPWLHPAIDVAMNHFL